MIKPLLAFDFEFEFEFTLGTEVLEVELEVELDTETEELELELLEEELELLDEELELLELPFVFEDIICIWFLLIWNLFYYRVVSVAKYTQNKNVFQYLKLGFSW